MRLYAGSSTHFIRDSTHNQIAAKLESAFFSYYRYNPSSGEVQSWQNSLRATATVFQEAAPLAEYLRMVEEAYGMKAERWELTR